MAHLFKPQIVYYVDAAGKRVRRDTAGATKVVKEARKWYAKGAPLSPTQEGPTGFRQAGGHAKAG